MNKINTEKTDLVARGAAAGSVFAGLLGASCCLGPPLFVLLGIGGAGLMSTVMPFRLPLLAISLLFLGVGFYFAYREPKECDAEYETPPRQKFNKLIIWIAAILVLFFIGFPYL